MQNNTYLIIYWVKFIFNHKASMLTIGISTVASSLSELIIYIQGNIKKIDPSIDFLICSQRESENVAIVISERIKVLKTNESGLSRSRNTLLKENKNKWLWIQDDDIKIEFEALQKLLETLSKSSDDLVFIKVKSLENKNEFYKNYTFHKTHRLTNSLKISSIEIVVRREFVNDNNIKFDTNLGLGTDLPCGEENKFVLNLFQSNAKVRYLDLATCFHTTVLEGREIDQLGRFSARGYLLRFYPFYISFPLMIRWAIYIPAELSFYRKIILMLRTYFKR